MKLLPVFTLLALVSGLCSCVTPPAGPEVMSLPGTGKSYEQFNRDEALCRGYAQNSVGNGAQTANDSAAGTAAAGTVVGAAAGALIGAVSGDAGPGALIGAGGGLLVGSSMAGSSASGSSADLQDRYDRVYSQCMYAKGNKVPVGYGYTSEDVQPASTIPPDYVPSAPDSGVPPDYVPH
ncbi:TPA: glycine zipper family protein [Serratia liquefaciens]